MFCLIQFGSHSSHHFVNRKCFQKGLNLPVKDVYEVRSESIIWAVKQLPCLWDLTSEEYRDRSKRRQGWSSVSRMLISDFDDKDEAERLSIGKPSCIFLIHSVEPLISVFF